MSICICIYTRDIEIVGILVPIRKNKMKRSTRINQQYTSAVYMSFDKKNRDP